MECTTEKKCPNCGEKLPGDSLFCVKCGTKVDEEVQSVGKSTTSPNLVEKNKRKVGIGVIAIIAIVLIVFIVNAVKASDLKRELMRDWQTVEGDDGAYILCILDFSENEIEYRLETGYAWMDMTVDTYEYKVISGNKIKVKIYGNEWVTVDVKFNEEKSMMTVSPALTSVDDEEQWFNFD